MHNSFCSQYEAPHYPNQRECCDSREGQMHRHVCARFKAEVAAVQEPRAELLAESDDSYQASEALLRARSAPPKVAYSSDIPTPNAPAFAAADPFGNGFAGQSAALGGAIGNDHILHDTWRSTSGASSSTKAPPIHLIPLASLCAEAERFGLGKMKHGRDNYKRACGTALRTTMEGWPTSGQDYDWIEDRINHGVIHMLTWLLEMEGYLPYSGDDHAGAVMWLGSIMREFGDEWLRRRKEAQGGQRA